MSLFLQSMCMMGWRYAEENAEFVRFESGEGGRLVSFNVFAPCCCRQPVTGYPTNDAGT